MKPFKHQTEGTRLLVDHPEFCLFDEMGTGKTRTVIDAMSWLYRLGRVGTVLVVAPAAVRSVWDGKDTGEIKQWCMEPYYAMRYDKKPVRPVPPEHRSSLWWIVTNYEFLRSQSRMAHLEALLHVSPEPLALVLDESSQIKTRTTLQTKAIRHLRQRASRVVLMNGTPVANNLMDFWSQLNILNPAIVDRQTYWQFRNTYAKMGGFKAKQVVGYREPQTSQFLSGLSRWVRRVEKKDCLDLPPKLYTQVEVALDGEAWRMYQEMETEFVAWAKTSTLTESSPTASALSSLDRAREATEETPAASVAVHGATRVLRLSQLTSGLIGMELDQPPVVVGDHKLDAFMDWQDAVSGQILVWCRFRVEIQRLYDALIKGAGRPAYRVWGGQSDKERQHQINEFKRHPDAVLIGQPQAGGWGLNLAEASTVVYLSNDYNLVTRLQSEDRAHRANSRRPVTYVDFLATTPEGGRTIDHVVMRALKRKEDLAAWSYSKWAEALRKEI